MSPRDAATSWLRQARNDLVHAHWSLQAGHADWACLAAHHATAMALKGLIVDAGHRPLATDNPALLAMDLMELGVLDEDDVAGLGDLDTLPATALRVRNPERAAGGGSRDETASLAATAVALSQRVLALVTTVTRSRGLPLGPELAGPGFVAGPRQMTG
ncbi:HEPN domain-containing protein [Roseospira navarrensis]|uniref:HEPN domain-containing protein n=1 Tax=Roseospira navarrensis TaxID=140058 RepID=A0A7X1ZDC7_9PROT|nr:HEPN domain-containing protein [Roseospira navarrensis]MQX36258.1 HEPN domain-containing protein [Roseospira navarrensis]